MRRTIRLAAKTHSIGLVISLLCLAVLFFTIIDGGRHISERVLSIVLPLLGFSFSVAFASAFYIAVADAIQRMEERERFLRETRPPV